MHSETSWIASIILRGAFTFLIHEEPDYFYGLTRLIMENPPTETDVMRVHYHHILMIFVTFDWRRNLVIFTTCLINSHERSYTSFLL
ncbi:MAG: hypothetical protein A2Z49_07220 [Chloroflexi bacterium RBG_19FT_COMBO_56_12]|nr:MAG: hypothetical protein A2Z49_07220 [Chloroflexi bacterium RBG_19FT_COMBO_56_12]